MKVLLFLANGVELMEASVFIDVFGWHRTYCNGNIEVITCGVTKEIKTTFDVLIKVDILLKEICLDEYDAIAIPGGFDDYGFYNDAYSKEFLEVINYFDKGDKPIASICVGALPLGKSGILRGRKGTTYHLMGKRRQKQLEEFGVNVINKPIVVDKNVITSWCPSTAANVAFELLEVLTSKEETNKVKEIMGY